MTQEIQITPTNVTNPQKPTRLSRQAALGQYLYELVLEQGEVTGFHPASILSSRKELIRGFDSSQAFRDRYQEAAKFYLLPNSEQEERFFMRIFAGAMFQGMALNAIAGTGLTLLPEAVLKFYQRIYPKALMVENPLGTTSLKGITVVDALGIRIDQPGVAAVDNVYECTLAGRPERYQKHYQGFLIRKRDYPKIFGDSQLVFITPRQPYLSKEIKKDPDVRVVELGITRSQFRNYIDALYKYYRPNLEGPTLLDLKDWAHFQFDRALAYSCQIGWVDGGNNEYTDQYKDYLLRLRGKSG